MLLLSIKEIGKSFGGLTALRAVSLDVKQGDIKALIGPNGAGKTTLLNIVSGIHKPDNGEVSFYGRKNSPPDPVSRSPEKASHERFSMWNFSEI